MDHDSQNAKTQGAPAEPRTVGSVEAELRRIESRRMELLAELRALSAESLLKNPLLALDQREYPDTAAKRVALFERLFVARTDVYPRFWEDRNSGRKGYSPVHEPVTALELEEHIIEQSGTKALALPVLGNWKASFAEELTIPTSGLSDRMVARLKHMATFPNPIFYEKQRQRFATYNIPRCIFSGELHADQIGRAHV